MIFTVNPQYRGLTAKFVGVYQRHIIPINMSENGHSSFSRGDNIKLYFYIFLQ